MYRASRKKRGLKRTKWWNEEVVAAKKLVYRGILEVETDEARQKYVEGKREAKKVGGELKYSEGRKLRLE